MSFVGRQIDRYRILEKLGQGGMSVVYRSFDTALEREVALKVLHAHLASEAEFRKRFEREARAVARLHHRNILQMFDYADGVAIEAFIVTEYIRGQTLRQFINADSLQPPEIAAMVVHEIAKALSHAHEAGVLHRDIKPENVMIQEDGVVKLMDFGIAKIIDRDEKMTMTGALVGSPAHMAPEILEGQEADAQSDIFSLGTMLYLCVTGTLPFSAANTGATFKKILDCTYEDPRKIIPTVSDELTEIIRNCLQRESSARYPSAGKLCDALARYLSDLGLSRPHEELQDFFCNAKGYRERLQVRITQVLLEHAEHFLAEKKTARAMAALNGVLERDVGNSRAAALLNQIKRRKHYVKHLRWGFGAGVLMCVILVGGRQAVEIATRPEDYTLRVTFHPAEVMLPAEQWPTLLPEIPEEAEKALHPSAKSATPARSASPAIEVLVVVRPFGYVQVDDGPRSADALSRHQLRLVPGRHRFTVTCDGVCLTGGSTVMRVVKAGEDILLVAPLKPSLVSFHGYPPEALVQVGTESRSASETVSDPFQLRTPPGGSTELRHRFNYTVRHQDQVIDQGTRVVEPGKPLIVVRELP